MSTRFFSLSLSSIVIKMAVYKVFGFMLVIVLVALQAKGISDVEAIEAQARIYETALAAGDIDRVERLYAEDCRIFNNDALPVRGRAALGESLRQARAAGLVTFQLQTTEIFPMGEFYYRSGINTVIGPNNTVIGLLDFVTIFRKDCGEWLYVVDMVNNRPSP